MPEAVDLSLFLPLIDYGRFRRFFIEDTDKGVIPFLMPDPMIDGALWLNQDGVPMLNSAGAPILITVTWLVQFSTLPAYTTRDIYWIASFGLEVLPS